LLVFVPLAAIADWRHAQPARGVRVRGTRDRAARGPDGRGDSRRRRAPGAGPRRLLNATFGNAAELIIALAALQHGYYDVVKASLTGSIIGNILPRARPVDLRRGIGRERPDVRSLRGVRRQHAAGASRRSVSWCRRCSTASRATRSRATGSRPFREQALERGLSLEIAVVLFGA